MLPTKPQDLFMKKSNHQRNQRGFTMLEACIALVFMLIVFVGIAPLIVYAINYNSGAAIRAGALAAGQKKLEQLRATPFASCVSSNEMISVGDTTTGLQTYIVETMVVDTTTTLKNITIRITPQARSTSGGQYAGTSGWMYGQVTIYTSRTSLGTGPNLG
jgi:Tfp pilus assembly protein PilV